MKRKKVLYCTLMFLPLAITLIALPFLPDRIPAHYDFNNQVTRYGSKYESLIYPAVTILMGLFMLWMAKLSSKDEKSGKNNEKVVLITGTAMLFSFNIMAYYSLYTDFAMVENLSDVPVNLYQLTFGIMGIVMIIIGNIMPKTRMNSLVGLRTAWSMKNETAWKKSQRFGGISFIVSGAVILLLCFFVKGFPCLLLSLGVLTIVLIVDVIYTWQMAKKC